MNLTGNYRTDQLNAAHVAYAELNWRLAFLRVLSSKAEPAPTDADLLKWQAQCPPKLIQHELRLVSTPNEFFQAKFPDHVKQFGPAFLEVRESGADFSRITPVTLNVDVWASCLSDNSMGMSVVYFQPELEWYYLEPIAKLYKPTTPERLACLYRGLMMRCFLEVRDTNKFALFHQFRDDPTSKAVVNRAKSIFSVEQDFFAPDSLNIRQQGSEWPERVALVLIESMLERKEGAVLTLTRAYNLFTALSIQREIQPIKKATFKNMMKDLMKQEFGICLRNDVPDENDRQQTGWKGVSPVMEAQAG